MVKHLGTVWQYWTHPLFIFDCVTIKTISKVSRTLQAFSKMPYNVDILIYYTAS